MIFTGHTRFSLFVPESKSWVASSTSHKSLEEYRDYLFSAERLEPRADMFFNYSLPQLASSMKNHSVVHVVSFSPQMPRKYHLMMEQASERFPWLVLDMQTEDRATVRTDDLARDLVAKDGTTHGVYGSYRLDDDDLLPTDYFDRMAEYTTTANIGMYVSFGKGLTAVQMDGHFYNPRIVRQRMFSAGLLAVCGIDPAGRVQKPVGYKSHSSADVVAPVIVDSREPGFFWNRHLLQDTALATGLSSEMEKMDWFNARLERWPAVKSQDEISARFPVLTGHMAFSAAPASHTEKILPAPVALNATGVSHSFIDPVAHVEVELGLECPPEVKQRNVLISFRFATKDGDPLDGNDVSRLAKNGFRSSSSEAVGFFKYVDTVAGSSTCTVSAAAPAGLRITSVVIRRWGTPNEIKLLAADVHY